MNDILRTLAFLHPDPGAVFEIRAFVGGRVHSGYFDDHRKASEAAGNLTQKKNCEAVFVTLNQCVSALLARSANRVNQCGPRSSTTADKDIMRLSNLLLDVDPIRPSGISSSDPEHEAAIAQAELIREDLTSLGWPASLLGDSGNGAHLLYRIDLANTPGNTALVKRVLQGLQDRYAMPKSGRIECGGIQLELDQRVFNPARISKVFGTWARKGDNTTDRPHRLSRIIHYPEQLRVVSKELLEAVAAKAEDSSTYSSVQRQEPNGSNFDLRRYLSEHGVEVIREKPHGNSTLFLLRRCLFDPSHKRGEAAIGQRTDGTVFYSCFHNSCRERTWHDARKTISGDERIVSPFGARQHKDHGAETSKDASTLPNWEFARELLPRRSFPWDVLPLAIAASLEQLARSCATSSKPIPGAAFAILASILGRSVFVSPKLGWEEPMIIWHGDIRSSGSGKTPATKLLMIPLYKAQKAEHERHQRELDHWLALPKKEKGQATPPKRPRGYFANEMTVEGLRDDLLEHPTGGLVCEIDELSAFLGGQNEYKSRGTDREAWLKLHDGKPARVLRVGKTVFLEGGRVSIFGGIQPGVFRNVFASNNGLYLMDGTIFRFLLTYEPSWHHDLDGTAWADDHREVWDDTIQRALWWVGRQNGARQMLLDAQAQEAFFEWRNTLNREMDYLPPAMHGFLPKSYAYALRLAGVIHCLHRFHEDSEPDSILTKKDIQRGIELAMFYLGQVVDVMLLMADEKHTIAGVDADPKKKLLAHTLDAIRDQVDQGRLAVSFVRDEFNKRASEQMRFSEKKQSPSFGLFLRKCGLTVTESLCSANGQRGVKCLLYDERVLQLLQPQSNDGCEGAEVTKSTSATSASREEIRVPVQNMQKSAEQHVQQGRPASHEHAELAENSEVFPGSDLQTQEGTVGGQWEVIDGP